MPREDRRVIFDMSETYQALYKLSTKQDGEGKLIAGAIVKIQESADDPNKIEFFIENPQINEKKTIKYTRDFVAAALMMYCRGVGIPLARKASKSIIIEKDRVTLRSMV